MNDARRRSPAEWIGRMKRGFARTGVGAALAGCALALFAACSSAAPDAPPPVPSEAHGGRNVANGILDETARRAFRAALDAAGRGEWQRAARRAERAGHPLVSALVEWRRLRSPDADISFAGIEAFLQTHQDWPDRATLVRRAEETMPEAYPDASARAWFAPSRR